MEYKITKRIQQAIESATSSGYISNIAADMIVLFNTDFGQGVEWTVATENYNLA